MTARFVDTNVLLYSISKDKEERTKAQRALAAFASRERFGISYWDAAVIEAARSLGCATVLSEDMSHDEDYDGVRIENPFA